MRYFFALLCLIAALPGAAFAQDAIKAFSIGIMGGENAQVRATNLECFRAQTEKLLGVPVTLVTPADYDGVIQGLLDGTLDFGWLGASAYAKVYLTDPNAVDVLLTKENTDGTTGYHAIGFAKVGSGINSMDDAKGKVFAFADPNSTSGYLVPAAELMAQYGKLDDYFGSIEMSGGHEQSILGVVNGDFDAAVVWADGLGQWEDGYNSGAFRKAVESGAVDMQTIQEIWRSAPIPEGPMVVRRALPQEVKDKIYAMLDGMWQNDKDCAFALAAGEANAFVPIRHQDYLGIIAARQLQEAK